MTLLEVSGLGVTYGAVKAVAEVDLVAEPGRITGLIGPNGAGKTTFIDAISGFVRSTGSIRFDGHEVHGRRPHDLVRRGLTRTFQSLELFEDLSVAENLRVVTRSATADGRWSRPDELLDAVGLGGYGDRSPSALSNGERKLVAVARALATGPRLVLLDEPAAGLDADESKELGVRLRALVDQGVGILLVDHDMGLVLGVCEVVHVLDFGRLIASGTPSEIRRDQRVISAYLGSHGGSDDPDDPDDPGDRTAGPAAHATATSRGNGVPA